MRRAVVSSGGSALKTEKQTRKAKIACSTNLLELAANGLQHVFENQVERFKKCIACQGRYFEKKTVTEPPRVPNRSNKVSPRNFQMASYLGFLIQEIFYTRIDEI
jgi:hypothetical protein